MRRKIPKASVIIPNWNGKELLGVCLDSLKNQSFTNFEIIVIDNGSTDGSEEFIKDYYPSVQLITLEENLGFAGAVNLGIKKSSSKLIILVNNDTKADKDFIKFLIQATQEHKVGLVAAKILQMDKPTLIDSAGDYIDAVGHANNIGYGEKDDEKFQNGKYVFLVSGGGCLIKREVLEKVGLFDEDYFAYMEDVDLSFRAQLQGFKAWYEPRAIIYHKHKATSSKFPELTEYLQYRNMTMTVIKNFPKDLFLNNFNWLKIILVNINTIRYLAGQGFLIAALKAEFYILTRIVKLIKKRKKIQSEIKVSSNYIIENIKPKQITLFGLLKPGF